MAIYEFEGKRPLIGASTFIHPQSVIIGDVSIGENCYVGAGAVIRGDYGSIKIADGSNVQENCVLHSEPDTCLEIQENVLVGHGAIVHGPCVLHTHSTVGMGAIVNNGCNIAEYSFLAAGSLLPPGVQIPARKLAMGNPAKVKKDVDEQLLVYNKIGIQLYQELAARCLKDLKRID